MRFTLHARHLILLLFLLPVALAQEANQRGAGAITMERIMADPDWFARSPSSPYWADDGLSIYWSQKRLGSDLRDLVQTDLAGKELKRVSDAERPAADVGGGRYSEDRSRKIYSRHGDLFLKELVGGGAGEITQLTKTTVSEGSAFFLIGDQRFAFRRDGHWFVRELQGGFEEQLAEIKGGEDPKAEEEEEAPYLEEQNKRLSEFLRKQEQDREAAEQAADARRVADGTRAPEPFYLGQGLSPQSSSLSPDGRWLAQVYGKDSARGKRDSMPVWVTESSYVEPRDVRSLVGTGDPGTSHLALFDLIQGRRLDVDLGSLPGITEDPLAEIKSASRTLAQDSEAVDDEDAAEGADEEAEAKPRVLNLRNLQWSVDGSRLALQAFSTDNKDRWTLRLDLPLAPSAEQGADLQPVVVERRTDKAWIGRIARGLGWLKDGRLWFQSETTGYSHLYLHDPAGDSAVALTSGPFEVTSVVPGPLGQYLYFRANVDHPGINEIHRIAIDTWRIEQVTDLGGLNSASVSPDGRLLLITHSALLHPPELYVQDAQPGAEARRLTHTVTTEFEALPWVKPRIVEVMNENGHPIYSRLYIPPDGSRPAAGRPAVFFVHGAGYMQNSHQGWSRYFREFMFHSLLAHRGYVVLDMDYRASAGYGRDWRTAIYRQMGTPELADLKHGVAWVVSRHGVDAKRIGVYGGSYGGFMTMMAMFRAPGLFAAGAALRPVTDWAHYNHGYTSNILNTPGDDPQAFEASSPIEYAEGLEGRLLICHGMLDDNVFFQDSVRLAQRLIELEKEDWEFALYPVERHGFRQPSSWLDEYRRILKLFEESLR